MKRSRRFSFLADFHVEVCQEKKKIEISQTLFSFFASFIIVTAFEISRQKCLVFVWIWTQTWKMAYPINHGGNTWKGKYQNGSDMYHTLDLNMSHVSLKLIHFSDTCLKGIDFHKRNKVLCSSMQRSSLIPDASSPKSSLCNYPPPFNLQKNGLS